MQFRTPLTLVLGLLTAWSVAQGAPAQTPPTETTRPQPAATTSPITAEQKQKVLDGINEVIDRRAFVPGVDFNKWEDFVASRKEAIDKAETFGAFSNAVNRALNDFGFSHIRLQTPRAAAQRNQTSTVGLGVFVTDHEKGLQVRAVVDDGPAKAAGLKEGDIIVKIDGQPAKGREMLEGEAGAKKELEVMNAAGESRIIGVELKRISTVRKDTLTWHGEDAAVLKIHTFSNGYSREGLQELLKEAAKAKYLMIDLRSNGGGAVTNMTHLLSLLLPDRTEFGVFITRAMGDKYKEAHPDEPVTAEKIAAWTKARQLVRSREDLPPFGGKIAVLINRGSGSASEIVTQAMREFRGAPIVGVRSAGAVLASTYAPLPEGFSLQFPVSDYVSGKGYRIEGNPIKPDHEVTGAMVDGKDPVVEKALEVLRSAETTPEFLRLSA